MVDDAVRRLDRDIGHIEEFLSIPVGRNDIRWSPAFNLRFRTLVCRAKLVKMEDQLRIITTLEDMSNPSQHTLCMISGMKHVASEQGKAQLATMTPIIAECETKNLKRLQAEARLVQIASFIVLRNLGVNGGLNVSASLGKISNLCERFPDTAGQFSNSLSVMKAVVAQTRNKTNLYAGDTRNIWWAWPKHEIGHLEHCRFGHPFSSTGGRDCPECGREVQTERSLSPRERLDPNVFLEAMKTFNLPDSYRGR